MRVEWAWLLLVLGACGPSSTSDEDAGGGEVVDAAPADPDPVFTSDERALLGTMRYDEGPPPPDPSNRVADDPAARLFGQRLFFETAFSGPLLDGDNDGSEFTLGVKGQTGRVSCAGCHVPEAGFVDVRSRNQQISLASRWVLRRTPSLLEVGFVPLLNWDGRRDALWNQAIGVMESDRELNSSRLYVSHVVYRRHRDQYEEVFGPMPPLDDENRFPWLAPEDAGCHLFPGEILECRGRPGDGAEFDSMAPGDQRLVTEVAVNVGKALGAYVRQLRCGPARFDAWLDGDASAMTRAEQRGAALFVGRAKCVECHSGPRLTDDRFHNVGLRPATVAVVFVDSGDRGAIDGIAAALEDPLNVRGQFSDGDDGRLPAEAGPELLGAFRTPSLRCVSSRPSFMHTAQMRTLEEVVAFFDHGGHPEGYPGRSVLEPLGLTPRERADLVAFLGALEGPGPDPTLLERR